MSQFNNCLSKSRTSTANFAHVVRLTMSCHPARMTLRNLTNSAREFYRRAKFSTPIACYSRRSINSGAQSICVTNASQPRNLNGDHT